MDGRHTVGDRRAAHDNPSLTRITTSERSTSAPSVRSGPWRLLQAAHEIAAAPRSIIPCWLSRNFEIAPAAAPAHALPHQSTSAKLICRAARATAQLFLRFRR